MVSYSPAGESEGHQGELVPLPGWGGGRRCDQQNTAEITKSIQEEEVRRGWEGNGSTDFRLEILF